MVISLGCMLTCSIDPVRWQQHLADFLQACPDLRKLKMRFRNDWNDTEEIFGHVARRVKLPQLKELSLIYIRCDGEHLRSFIGNHRDLHKLVLEDLDLTGNVSFRDVLVSTGEGLDRLVHFRCRQIAQNSLRLCFSKSW